MGPQGILWRDFLANSVVVIHAIFLLFLFVGPFLAAFGWFKKRPTLELLYAGILLAGVAGFAIARECLLTRLEYIIRRAEYEGGCVKHYLAMIGIHVEDLWVFWATVIATAAGLILTLGRRAVHRGGSAQTSPK